MPSIDFWSFQYCSQFSGTDFYHCSFPLLTGFAIIIIFALQIAFFLTCLFLSMATISSPSSDWVSTESQKFPTFVSFLSLFLPCHPCRRKCVFHFYGFHRHRLHFHWQCYQWVQTLVNFSPISCGLQEKPRLLFPL